MHAASPPSRPVNNNINFGAKLSLFFAYIVTGKYDLREAFKMSRFLEASREANRSNVHHIQWKKIK